MTPESPNDPASPSSETPRSAPGRFSRMRRRVRWLFIGAPAVALGFWAARAHARDGGRCGGRMGGHWRDLSDAERAEHIDRRLDRILNRLNATDGQKKQIKEIVARNRATAKPLHEEHKKLHAQFLSAIGADPINPGEIERLRNESVAIIDRGSKVLGKTLVEVSGVLTPDQRKKIMGFLALRGGPGPGIF